MGTQLAMEARTRFIDPLVDVFIKDLQKTLHHGAADCLLMDF